MRKILWPVKIMYVIGQLEVGGTETQLLELARHLDPNKYKILVVCLSGDAPLASSFVEAGCGVKILGREKKKRALVFWNLYLLFKDFLPDIVHSFAYASRAAIPVSKLFINRKNIVSIRTQPGEQIIWLDYLINSFADYILANSKKAGESVRFGFPKTVPRQVVYNGVDLHKFDKESNQAFALDRLPDSNAKVICVVARLFPVKGLDYLLNAFAIVSKSSENVQLWIVGDGPEKEKLLQKTDELGISSSVTYWGQQKNIPAILKNADIGVLSSRIEGLPNAIIEYMASRLPVVATNVGGNCEVVVHNQTGLLVPFGKPREMADAILFFLQNPNEARRFGEAGRRCVEENFTTERLVAETEIIYDDLLTSGKY